MSSGGPTGQAGSVELPDLDPRTRRLMLAELARDLEGRGARLHSALLSARGRADWPELLREALGERDAAWLEEELLRHGRLSGVEPRAGEQGGSSLVRATHPAAAAIAREFERYYARAVCRRALDAGHGVVEVYPTTTARTAPGQVPTGRLMNARLVLTELRWHPSDVRPPSGVPGPGIGVRLPRA